MRFEDSTGEGPSVQAAEAQSLIHREISTALSRLRVCFEGRLVERWRKLHRGQHSDSKHMLNLWHAADERLAGTFACMTSNEQGAMVDH